MTAAFDSRLMEFAVNIDGETYIYDQSYYLAAYGVKYTNGNLGECSIRIDNIARHTRDTLISKTSPFAAHRQLATVSLKLGRQSTGLFTVFEGQATASNPTQPPDIGLFIHTLAGSYWMGTMVSNVFPTTAMISVIAKKIADDLGLALEFHATDRAVVNFTFTGAAVKQVKRLNEVGGIEAHIDTGKLIVRDINQPRRDTAVIVSQATGMIGVPQINEYGVNVTMLINQELLAGDKIEVKSDLNPAANGTYTIYKLGFEASSWETPFYWKIEARRYLVGA